MSNEINKVWNSYINSMQFENPPPEIQQWEMQKAFYAGCAAMMSLCERQKLFKLNFTREEHNFDAGIYEELSEFFQKEIFLHHPPGQNPPTENGENTDGK